MTAADPMARLLAALDDTVTAWGWWSLAVLPAAVFCVAWARLMRIPEPPAPLSVPGGNDWELWTAEFYETGAT